MGTKLIQNYLSWFRLIWAHLDLFRLIQALLSSFQLMHHWENLFRLNCIRKMHTSHRGPPFCLDFLSFKHQFNLRSRTLSETIGKSLLLSWGVGTLWEAVITGKTTKLKIRIPMWLRMQFAWLRFACNINKVGPCVTFSGIK